MTLKNRCLLLFCFLGLSAALAAQSDAGVRRYGIFIGANDGGVGRVTLRWAVTDAEKMHGVMEDFGGVRTADGLVLRDPGISDVYRAFSQLSQQIQVNAGQSRRQELLVYYSGHSDEVGLMLGEEHLGYASLREMIESSGADVSIAILDSCASGAFTRLKGGERVQPFLLDDAARMTGYAYLTSASADEAAQESDRIGASFFTHFMVSGLRGAADSSGDGKVTLNEAYHYAFNETLSYTENSFAGPQHPSYEISLNGSGDLVLSQPDLSQAQLTLREDLAGRVYIRNSAGTLAAELSKHPGASLTIGLRPDTYAVTISSEAGLFTASVVVSNNATASLDGSQLSRRSVTTYRSRGDAEDSQDSEDDEHLSDKSVEELTAEFGERLAQKIQEDVSRALALALSQSLPQELPGDSAPLSPPATQAYQEPAPVFVPFQFSLVPGLPSYGYGRTSAAFAVSPIISSVDYVHGAQIAGIGAMAPGQVNGFQTGGIYALAGPVNGVQIGGVFSDSAGVNGAQIGGVFNRSSGPVIGSQIGGIFNIAGGNFGGAQIAGIFNVAEGDVGGVQFAGILNDADWVRGGQISLVNHATRVSGLQIGLVNISDGTVAGSQIGLVNVADDMYGIPLGLVSWVRQGIHDMTVWFAGSDRVWVGTQNGTRNVYHSIYLGVDRNGELSDLPGVAMGTSLGVRVHLNPFFADAEIGIRRASEGETAGERFVSLFTGDPKNIFPTAKVNVGFGFGEIKGYIGMEMDGLIEGLGNVTEFHYTEDGEPFDVSLSDWGLRVFPKFIFGFSLF